MAVDSAARCYDDAQTYMDSTFNSVQNTLSRMRATLNSKLNQRLSIDTIPNEILGVIFEHYIALDSVDMNPRSIDTVGPIRSFHILDV